MRYVEDAERLGQAIQHINAREFNVAEQILLGVVSRTPGWWRRCANHDRLDPYVRAYLHLGCISVERGELNLAEKYIDKGLSLDPENPLLRLEMVQVILRGKKDEIAKALALCKAVLAKPQRLDRKSYARAFRTMGYCYMKLNDLVSAGDVYVESLQYDPENQIARDEVDFIGIMRERLPQLGICPEYFRAPLEGDAVTIGAEQRTFNRDL